MPIPRRLLVIAAGAIGTGVVLYLRNRTLEQKRQEQERERDFTRRETPASGAAAGGAGAGAPGAEPAGAAGATGATGAVRELSQFLAGESWYDEMGWHGIWDREGIEGPEHWLKSTGKDVLATERRKLTEHPALLAGCRRRWIVVCRYAGIDVTDAAGLWNEVSEAA